MPYVSYTLCTLCLNECFLMDSINKEKEQMTLLNKRGTKEMQQSHYSIS